MCYQKYKGTMWPVERLGALHTLICAPVVRPKQCPTSSNPALLPSSLNGGLSQLHSADDAAIAWVTNYGS